MSITTRFPKIPEDQITPLVAELLELIQLQMEEIQFLRDEIARLKGQKPRPNIKPSRLETDSNRAKTRRRKRPKKSKTKKIEIHEVVSIKPDDLPDGSKLKDYQEYIVQDLIIGNWNICYRRQRWQTQPLPADKTTHGIMRKIQPRKRGANQSTADKR